MAINFADGTITLKTKMTTATGAEPKLISSTTPPHYCGAFGRAEGISVHNGVEIGWDIKQASGGEQCQSALDAVVLPQMHCGTAARALMHVGRGQF